MKCSHCNGTGIEPVVRNQEVDILFRDIVLVLQSTKTKPTSGRLNKLKLRLKKFTSDEILKAAVNLSNSPWHMGDNPNKVKYANIDFLLRSEEQVDNWFNVEPAKKEFA